MRSDCFTTPGSVFSHFFDDEVMAAICSWINERADVFRQENPNKRLIHRLKWRAMTTDKLHALFCLITVVRVIKKPYIHMYWSRDVGFGGIQISCKEVMSKNRFTAIIEFLRFSSAASGTK